MAMQKCAKCGAVEMGENATFCKRCKSAITGAKSRWLVPE